MNYEENNYILTSIEIDEQFVDNASDSYMTDEEREYWIDGEEGNTDEEIEETYQMSDEEQKGLEQYLVDTREDVPECMDAKINLLWDTITGETSKAQRDSERRDAIKRAKENQRILERNPHMKSVIDGNTIQNLNNHFNA